MKAMLRGAVLGAAWAGLGLVYAAPAVAAGGIGGTGITTLGPIERFGSIFVDHREYHLRGARVRVDGRPAGRQALHRGQMVLVQARRVQGHWTSLRVSVRHALQGPITAIHGHSLTVFGQPIEGASARFVGAWAALRPGEVVRVSGFPGPRGWTATRITRVEAVGARPLYSVMLRGLLRRTPRGLMVRDVRLDGVHPSARLLGHPVRVEGVESAGRIQWQRVYPDRLALGVPGTRVDMTGYAHRRRGGWQVQHIALRFEHSGPRRGALVAVRGVVARGGTVVVRTFENLQPERWGLTPRPTPERPQFGEPPETPEVEGPPVLTRPTVERPEMGH